MNDQNNIEQRITERINPQSAAMITTGKTGALAFGDAAQLMEFSKMMAIAQVAIPKHLRGSPGACLAVAIQASEWEMSPFAVANKSYCVNDRLAYEAQLINAVILKRAPIRGRFKVEYSGEGQKRKCTVSATLLDGDTVEYESPAIGDIKVQNSPLWKSDPDQQLFYFSSRSMCRRHFPDVILGVYTPDEIHEMPEKDVTPKTARAVPLDPFTQTPAVTQPPPETETPVVEAEYIQPAPEEPASQESPPVEDTPLLLDLLDSVAACNTAADLTSYAVQCAEINNEAHRTVAKNAVVKKAKELELVWDKKTSQYLPA